MIYPRNQNIVAVTGIGGSGKDYLLRQAFPPDGQAEDITVVPFGTRLYELLKDEPGVETRDQIRLAHAGRRRKAALEIGNHVVRMAQRKSSRIIVVNGHVAHNAAGELGAHDKLEELLNPRHYIFVTADPVHIVRWRENDQNRSRSIRSVDYIASRQDRALAIVTDIAQRLSSDLTVVYNHPDKVAKNAQIIRDVIRNTPPRGTTWPLS